MVTQRFIIALATDGDVTEQEIGESLGALGYHGVALIDVSTVKDGHEHPCPSTRCIDTMRSEGHPIPDDVECCICWVLDHFTR